jgi:PAS domain S-box-containing protein
MPIKTKNTKNTTEQLLRATLYSIGDAVIATDKRGKVTLINPVAEKLTGWKEREARGEALGTVFRIVNEETRKKVENPVKRVLREGIVVGFANHTLLISRNGKEIPIADAGAPIKDESGKVVGVVLVFRDQTAERMAQRAVQDAREFAESIIATVREPLLILDEKLEVVSANRSFYNVFKVKPEETIGKKIYHLGNRQWNIPALRKLLEEILPSNSHFDDFEVTHDFEHIGKHTMVLNARRLFREENRSKLILLAIEDITERKRAEEALKESEERFHRITNIISDYAYTFRVNPDKTLTGEWLSESFTKVFGFTQPEIQARGGWQSMVFSEDLRLMQQHALKVAGGAADVCETRFVTRSGEVRWIRDYATPVWDERQQRVIRIYGAAQDITEQKKAERAVREREEWFRRLADTTSTAIFIYQGERFVYVNKATEELSGYTNQELLSLRFWDVVHPDFRDLVRQRGLARQSGEEVPNRYEFQIVRKDGTARWIDFTAGKIDWQGKPAAIGTAFDVTERKRVEEALREGEHRYRSIVENINQAYYEADRRAMFTYCNPGALIISGYAAEELLGTVSYRLIADEDRRKVIAQYEQWYKEKRTDMAMEFRVQTKNGRIFWVEQVTHFKFDAQGNFVKATNVLRDIDERKRAEEELKQSEERYRLVLQHSLDAIYLCNADTKHILEANQAFLNLLGYNADEITALTLYDIVAHEQENIDQYLQQVMTSGGIMIGERQWKRKDGTLVDVDVSMSKIRLNDQNIFFVSGRDITERKRAQKQIDMLAHAVRSIGECVSITDMEDKLLFVNEAFLRTYGYEEHDLIGKHIGIVRSPNNAPEVVGEILPDTLRGTWQGELLNRRKDGSEFPIFLSTSVIHDDNGQPTALIGVATDITERKRAEEELRKSEDRYRTLFQSVGEAILISDAEGRYVEVNEEACDLTGYSRDELLRMTVGDLVEGDRDDLLNGYRIFHEQMRTRRVFRAADSRMRRKDGTVFEYEVNAVYLENDLLMALIRDITERNQAEEKLRRSHERYERFFMEDLTGDYISTPDGGLIACNPAFVRIFGFASVEEALNTNLISLFRTPEEHQQLLSRLQRERKLEYHEMQMRKRDGAPLHIIANIIGHFDEHDRLVDMQGYFFDDTKRRQLEEQLLHAQKLESLGTLASGIAHDFNNILGIIMGHTSLLERFYPSSERSSRSLEAVQKASQRGAALVRQLLTFARKTDVVAEPVHINDVIHEITALIHETFPKAIEVTTDLDKKLPAITADHTQLHQVILNLCVNARDAMPQGGSLIIRTRLLSGHDVASSHPGAVLRDYVMIEVQDTGIGMDESTRRRIFEPFFTTKGIGKGTGLGLSVLHGIVEAQSGLIDVESTIGKGSTFRIYLPAGEPTILEYQSSPEFPVEVQGGSETILIVEDEPFLRELLQTLLAARGYNVLAAENGKNAVELYASRHRDIALVISDMGLPLLSGEEVFRRIREINPQAKVILASGFVEPLVKSELLKSGVQDFIQKPYTLNEVLQKARKVLDAGG